MAKVTFILGLAGSGKTHLAKQLCDETGAEFVEGTEGSEDKKTLLLQYLSSNKDCIVEEIAYCMPSQRENIVSILCSRFPNIEIEWVCFENDIEKANWNVKNRINKENIDGHLHINRCYQGLYIYPGAAEIISITKINERKTTS